LQLVLEGGIDGPQDKKTRDQAFKDLSIFLSRSASSADVLSDVEMAKLWKGIFYSSSSVMIGKAMLNDRPRFCRLLDVGQATRAASTGQ
jgi:hypothetical protein